MWREPAIRSLLLEGLCNLPRIEGEDSPIELSAQEDAALESARKRALLVVLLCWAALAVLFLLRAGNQPWMPTAASEETIFTLGILAVAIFSGYRLGQLEKVHAVRRVLQDLREQAGDV